MSDGPVVAGPRQSGWASGMSGAVFCLEHCTRESLIDAKVDSGKVSILFATRFEKLYEHWNLHL